MEKVERREWTPEQKATLLSIPNDKKRKAKLEKLTLKWGIPYRNIYIQWNYMHHKMGTFQTVKGNKPVSKPAKVSHKENGITLEPMKFEIIENFNGRSRVDPIEEKRMQMGLDITVKHLDPETRRGVLFPRRMINRAKQYLTKTYPKYRFSFSGGKSVKKGNVVIVRTQ